MSTDFKEKQMLCIKVFPEYTKEKWQNYCPHMKKTEEKYGLVDEAINGMIIHLGERSDYEYR
jgi:hypothetical protein